LPRSVPAVTQFNSAGQVDSNAVSTVGASTTPAFFCDIAYRIPAGFIQIEFREQRGIEVDRSNGVRRVTDFGETRFVAGDVVVMGGIEPPTCGL
jgi:hypothetical protein